MMLLYVSLAGASGALTRFGMTFLGNYLFYDTYFPVATLVINVLAATLMGTAMAVFTGDSATFQIVGGFLGGFSTYSTFTNEFVGLLQHYPRAALSYLLLTILLGVGGAALGYNLGTH